MKVYIVEGNAFNEESNCIWKVGAYSDKQFADSLCENLNSTLGDCLMPMVTKYCEPDGYFNHEVFEDIDEVVELFEPLIKLDGVLTKQDMSSFFSDCMLYYVTEMEIKWVL